MKYFSIYGKINDELFQDFLKFANENKEESWTIFINSGGGTTAIAYSILDIIKNKKEHVSLVSNGVYSAAFMMFFEAKCKRKITRGTMGMMHKGHADLTINTDGKANGLEDEYLLKNWKETRYFEDAYTSFMTDQERKKYNRGEDVYFTFKRMVEIIPDAEII